MQSDPIAGGALIRGDDGNEYVLARTNAVDATPLARDDRVRFEIGPEIYRSSRRHAVKVSLLARAHVEELLVQNPFDPQRPTSDPARFAGRLDHLRDAIHYIYSRQNILLTGQRGVGKSSTALQLLNMTNGDDSLFERLGLTPADYKYRHAVASYSCGSSDTLSDIVRGLTASLLDGLEKDERLLTTTQAFEAGPSWLKLRHETERGPRDLDAESLAGLAHQSHARESDCRASRG